MGSSSPAAPVMTADVAAPAHPSLHSPHKAQPRFHHHLWRNTNQHQSKHAPGSLPALAACTRCVLTIPAHCEFQVLKALGAASGALWCQSQKLVLTPVQSLETLTHREKFAAKASFPCQLFHKSRKRHRLFPSSGLLSFRWVSGIS